MLGLAAEGPRAPSAVLGAAPSSLGEADTRLLLRNDVFLLRYREGAAARGHFNPSSPQVLLSLLENLAVPGAREVMLGDRRALVEWASRCLGWPLDRDIWARIGHVLGRRRERYPRTCASWAVRARPGRCRRGVTRRGGTPLVVLLKRDAAREGLRGKYASGLSDVAENSEVFSLAGLRNLDPSHRIAECWIFDEESMELIGGWANDFVGKGQANRWRHKSQVLLATQMPIQRGPRKEHLPGGRMVGAGAAVPRASRTLREYLASPATRREPEGLTLRANLSSKRDLLREFLGHVRVLDEALVEELALMYEESPELPPPMWVTRNYQVSGSVLCVCSKSCTRALLAPT